MEKLSFNYALKNIPLPSQKSYKTKLIEKVEQVIKRMRWKAAFLDKKEEELGRPEKFGFKTRTCPPQVKEMIPFENDLFDMIKRVKFREVNKDFQKQLNEDLQKIKSSDKVFIFADKTRNIYEVTKESHDKLLTENITKTYRKDTQNEYNNINEEAKEIAKKLKIDNRVEILAKKNAFITLKDHKNNFENAPKCRLLNPSKSELGTVSKIITERINTCIKQSTNVNQWKNTTSVIDWFTKIENKQLHTFIQFDIVDFYPSISDELFQKAIDFGKRYTVINSEDERILMHCKRSMLFKNNESWVKKGDNHGLDITMGSMDGAESCELVGLFILYTLGNKFGKQNLGLYRDDGLGSFKNLSGHQSDKIRKEITNVFNEMGLKITIQANLKIVNFLDATFNLNDGTFRPYKKPNDTPLYINVDSNHPPNIIKQIPATINKRINELSSNEEMFKRSAPYYNDALAKSGYTEKLKYDSGGLGKRNRRNRSRRIIWFNPPYSDNVKSNIGRDFLQLIRKHFPKNNKFHKIFNKNNVKVSYSCMPNFATHIKSHNAKILNSNQQTNSRKCNCRNITTCPLQGNCLVNSIVYRGKIVTTNEEDVNNYVGMTENEFKGRERYHHYTFQHEEKRTSSKLSDYIWELKKKNIESNIEYTVLEKAQPYKNGTKRCPLCIAEKFHIIFQPFEKVNQREELVSKCRHENKYYLKNFKYASHASLTPRKHDSASSHTTVRNQSNV